MNWRKDVLAVALDILAAHKVLYWPENYISYDVVLAIACLACRARFACLLQRTSSWQRSPFVCLSTVRVAFGPCH